MMKPMNNIKKIALNRRAQYTVTTDVLILF